MCPKLGEHVQVKDCASHRPAKTLHKYIYIYVCIYMYVWNRQTQVYDCVSRKPATTLDEACVYVCAYACMYYVRIERTDSDIGLCLRFERKTAAIFDRYVCVFWL